MLCFFPCFKWFPLFPLLVCFMFVSALIFFFKMCSYCSIACVVYFAPYSSYYFVPLCFPIGLVIVLQFISICFLCVCLCIVLC